MKIRTKTLLIFAGAMVLLFSGVFVLSTQLVAGFLDGGAAMDPLTSAVETRRQFVSVLLVAFTVAGGGLFLLVFFGLDRAVLAPIRNLQRSVAEARGKPLKLATAGRDEVSLLAREIERLSDSLRAADDERRQLSGKLLAAQDDERRRIARELHDSTAQVLTAIQMNLAILDGLPGDRSPQARRIVDETRGMANQCCDEIRTISHLLHPPLLDEVGLVFAVRLFIDGFTKRTGTVVDLKAATEMPRLPSDVATALFRVVQESLSNVHRHSGATRVEISIEALEAGVAVQVADDGVGLDGEGGAMAPLGVGLLGMRERIEQFGGTLSVTGSAAGTKVQAFVSLDCHPIAG